MNDSVLKEKYKNILLRYQSMGYFPSGVLRVFDKSGDIFNISIGEAELDSVFDVASLTKLATSTQIMFLIKSGVLSVYDCVLEYLPEISKNQFLSQRLKDVSIFSMLTHTSTLPAWYPLYTLEGSFADRLEAALKNRRIESGVIYSDINFMLLGKIIENCTDMPLDEALQANLVLPWQLGTMLYNPQDLSRVIPSSFDNAREERLCKSVGLEFSGFRHRGIICGKANDGNAYYYFNGVAGHAGIFADTNAYKKLCLLYMTKNCPFLLSAMQNKGMNRGFGFQHGANYPDGCGHSGFTGTGLWISKNREIAAVLFTNRLLSSNPYSNNDIWNVRREIFYSLYQDILKKG